MDTARRTEYVVGFLFNVTLGKVVLIKKNKPDWQAGKLNGVGGKIEEGEQPKDAMRREFQEEAGVDVSHWKLFVRLSDVKDSWCVFFFWAIGSKSLAEVSSMTDEQLVQADVSGVLSGETIPGCMSNIPWLMQMALNDIRGTDRCSYFTIYEVEYRP